MSLLSIIQRAQFLSYRLHQAADAHIGGVVRDYVWSGKQLEDSLSRVRELRNRSRAVARAGEDGHVVDETA